MVYKAPVKTFENWKRLVLIPGWEPYFKKSTRQKRWKLATKRLKKKRYDNPYRYMNHIRIGLCSAFAPYMIGQYGGLLQAVPTLSTSHPSLRRPS